MPGWGQERNGLKSFPTSETEMAQATIRCVNMDTVNLKVSVCRSSLFIITK